jgi:transcriptional regulator with XRE-family HTH domain
VDARHRDLLAADLRLQAGEAGWTSWELARHVHESAGTPTLLMAWRLAAGLTQAQLAGAVRRLAASAGSPCGPSAPSCQQISRWENGHDKPGAFYQGLLAAWYQTDPARLGLIGDLTLIVEQSRLASPTSPEDDVDRRGFLSATAAVPVLFRLDQIRRRMDVGLRHVVPAAEVDQWTQTAGQHIAAYGTLAPAILLERLAPDLSDLADLAAQYPQQRDLARLTSRLCGLTGAVHTDLCDHRAARDWLHTASRYADMSDDLATRYWVAMAQAMTATYAPAPARVLAIAGKTTAELGPCAAAAAAQLTGLAARAHATLGDPAAARTQLASAERVVGRLTADQTDEVFFGFPHREMAMYTSQVLTATGDPAAWNAQTDALAGYPATDPMDRPLILLDRARHLARHGNPDQAADTATTAITSLTPAQRVPLLITQAREVGKDITAASPHTGSQYARALREAIPA